MTIEVITAGFDSGVDACVGVKIAESTCLQLVFTAVKLREKLTFLQDGTMRLPDYDAHIILGATTNSSLISADVAT